VAEEEAEAAWSAETSAPEAASSEATPEDRASETPAAENTKDTGE
jgi:hypothetical protein